jgi:hypothetical protein
MKNWLTELEIRLSPIGV